MQAFAQWLLVSSQKTNFTWRFLAVKLSEYDLGLIVRGHKFEEEVRFFQWNKSKMASTNVSLDDIDLSSLRVSYKLLWNQINWSF